MQLASTWRRAALALVPCAVIAAALAPPAAAQTQAFQHRWGGFVPDSFVLQEGGVIKQWTAEDRRVRYRTGIGSSASAWTQQELPEEVEGIVRRLHFLPTNGSNELIGWAVTSDGYVLKTLDGGGDWDVQDRIGDTSMPSGYADLQDIHFLDEDDGWLVGLYDIYYSGDGGDNWFPVTVSGHSYNAEYYAIDVVERSNGNRLGLIVGEPGIVLRAHEVPSSTHFILDEWDVVMDTTDLCSNPAGNMAPAGDLDCCQENHCNPGTPYEPWDVAISRDGSALAAVVSGLGQQCGLIVVTEDATSTGQAAGFTIEQHECVDDPEACVANSAYFCFDDQSFDRCDPQGGFSSDTTPKRHCRLPTLYGVGMAEDNTVWACGYNGATVVRDATSGVWEDRSSWLSPFIAQWESGVVYPLFGVSIGIGSGSTAFALITGQGGYTRETLDGGQTWQKAGAQGTSWRIQDVAFTDTSNGYLVGQSARVAHSTDGGANWNHMPPLPAPGQPFLNAIAIASDGFRGVAVGDMGTSPDEVPKILYHEDVTSSDPWSQASTDLTEPDIRSLRDVVWTGGSDVWGAGTGGLILKSTNDGEDWTAQDFSGDDGLFAYFNVAGLAFNGTSSGVFVGQQPQNSSTGPLKGAAWRYKSSADPVWASVVPGSGGPDLWRLTAVTVSGSTAWAVGEQINATTQEREGVVLYSIDSGSGFGTFIALNFAPGLCVLGGSLDDQPPPPILGAVAVDPNGDLLVAGACGRMWKGTQSGSTWSFTEVNTTTASHVLSISIVPDGSGFKVFIGAYRKGEETQAIMVY